ncbi:MAG: hypothetical protein ACLFNR_00485 [Candidatus Paceibacterota bacterium]
MTVVFEDISGSIKIKSFCSVGRNRITERCSICQRLYEEKIKFYTNAEVEDEDGKITHHQKFFIWQNGKKICPDCRKRKQIFFRVSQMPRD